MQFIGTILKLFFRFKAIVINHIARLGADFDVQIRRTSWPLVGNEGMNPQYTNVKVDSLIPYESGPEKPILHELDPDST